MFLNPYVIFVLRIILLKTQLSFGSSLILKNHGFHTYTDSLCFAPRKIQFAPTKPGRQPCTVVRKDFALSPGELELEATLDR